MRVFSLAVSILFVAARAALCAPAQSSGDWSMNATAIEACSCPMFCQCYFNDKPAAHGEHAGHSHGEGGKHFCKFNMAYKINSGYSGGVKLDGAKFWIAGDLGGDFSKNQMDWAAITFDPSVSPEQRDAIKQILGHVFPVKWNSFTVANDAPIEWNGGKEKSEARLDGGKAGEILLKKFPGMTSDPIVIANLKYWGAPRNDGFVLMPNTVEAYRLGDKAYEFKGTNGFMITIDINSKDIGGKEKTSS